MRYAYPVDIDEAADGVTVTCGDLPELVTEGATCADAIQRAADAMASALAFYVEEGRSIPQPSPANGRPVVSVTPSESAKLALHDAMLAAKISNVELGRMLMMDETAVQRLRDPLRRSDIGAVEAALRTLGLAVDVPTA